MSRLFIALLAATLVVGCNFEDPLEADIEVGANNDNNEIDSLEIDSVSPSPGVMDAPIDVVIELTFSDTLDPETVTAAAIEIDQDGTPVPASVTADGNVATVDPDEDLAEGTQYRVTVSTEVTSVDGATLEDPYQYLFTTQSGDVVGNVLDVVSTVPADGMTDVDVSAPLEVVFNADIDASTIDGAFALAADGGGEVSLTVSVEADTVFLSHEGLQPDTLYTATVSEGLLSTEGLALDEPETWTFTTEAGAAFDFVSVVPNNNATEVRVDRPIVITMSADVDAGTVTQETFSIVAQQHVAGSPMEPFPFTVEVEGNNIVISPPPTGWQEYWTDYVGRIEVPFQSVDGATATTGMEFTFRTVFWDEAFTYTVHNEAGPVMAVDPNYDVILVPASTAGSMNTIWRFLEAGTAAEPSYAGVNPVSGMGWFLEGLETAPARMRMSDNGMYFENQKIIPAAHEPRRNAAEQGVGETYNSYYLSTARHAPDLVFGREFDSILMLNRVQLKPKQSPEAAASLWWFARNGRIN